MQQVSTTSSRATISATTAQVMGAVVLLLALAVIGGAQIALWGRDGLEDAARWPVFVAIALGVVVHELIHCVGFVLGGAPRSAVRIGFDWRRVIPFASCSVPLRCRGYRLAVALPTLVLGIAPAAAGLAFDSPHASLFGAFLVGTAAGDLLVLWAIRGVAADALVEDHPTEIGCRVLAD